MMDDVFETVLIGSNTIFLEMDEKEYFPSYHEDLDVNSAQQFVETYFKMKGREGIPKVRDVDMDSTRNRVKLTVEIDMERKYKLDEYNVPDVLNIRRKE